MEINKIKTKDNSNHVFESQSSFNESTIRDLLDLLKTHSTVPTYTPKKLIDCIYLYFDGTSTYRLYLYINNTWKYSNLS